MVLEMAQNVDELRADIAEIRSLVERAGRTRVKNLLELELHRLETAVAQLSEPLPKSAAATAGEGAAASASAAAPAAADQRKYAVQLRNYAWDQSENFLKFYITNLPDINKLTQEHVKCYYKPTSFDLNVRHVNGKSYRLNVTNLLRDIVPDQSYVKVKKDSILVMMKKLKGGEHWDYVTKQEESLKAKKKEMPTMDDKSDPSAGLMSMMKQMYEDGDDDMKRTIAKAWTESREKQAKGETGMPGMPGMDF